MAKVGASLRDAVRTQLWPLPVVAVRAAVVGGVFVPRLDAHVDHGVPNWLRDLLFGGDAGAASTLLDAISSSLITVTSLTFSLTVVTLQLASSQFSPRLLRTFTSDVFVQATLAIFLATFTYSLTVLRAVRSGDNGGTPFVPRISVTLAFILAAVSVIGLVLFLAHLARQIRVETMLRDVHGDATDTIGAATVPFGEARPRPELPSAPDDALVLTAATSGFPTSLDEGALRQAAERADAFVVIDRFPGSSMVAGTPIGLAWKRAGRLDRDESERLQHAVGEAVRVGYERTAAQDIGYGLRQLTDVAIKALSPGINDPTTAVYALGHSSALLCQLAARDLGPLVICNSHGHALVLLRRPTIANLLDEAVTQPRRYGKSDPFVLRRLFGLLEDLAWHVRPGADQEAVTAQLGRLRATVADADLDPSERADLQNAATTVEHALQRGVSSIP